VDVVLRDLQEDPELQKAIARYKDGEEKKRDMGSSGLGATLVRITADHVEDAAGRSSHDCVKIGIWKRYGSQSRQVGNPQRRYPCAMVLEVGVNIATDLTFTHFNAFMERVNSPPITHMPPRLDTWDLLVGHLVALLNIFTCFGLESKLSFTNGQGAVTEPEGKPF
tara:strand:- start:55 stop:552 length:498 start_codon:yes stop_codon:yes gene_type:complete